MSDPSRFFPESYFESLAKFRRDIERVQVYWPSARLVSHPLSASPADGIDPLEGLTLDWIEAAALEKPEKLFIFTAGQHGIEGYTGATMFEVFLQEFLPHLDPRSTGLLLFHALNPWGMQHHRKANAFNVDLNRNFVWRPADLNPAFNADYRQVEHVLAPQDKVHSLPWSKLAFLAGVGRGALNIGIQRLGRAATLGQYCCPKGIYYGGDALQEETRTLMALYHQGAADYEHILLLDMHSGYGPQAHVTVICSPLEPRSPEELLNTFGYPRVVKTTSAKFYTIAGDMIDYIYILVGNEGPGKRVFAATLEVGTLGDSTVAALLSLRGMVLENQLYWYGAVNQSIRDAIGREYEALYNPRDPAWQIQVLDDTRQALAGVLLAEGFAGAA